MAAIHLPTGFAIAALLVSGAALATEPGDAEAGSEITVEEALDEPADPDDEMDIRDDNDPNDVGQRALDPEGEGASPSSAPSAIPELEAPPAQD